MLLQASTGLASTTTGAARGGKGRPVLPTLLGVVRPSSPSKVPISLLTRARGRDLTPFWPLWLPVRGHSGPGIHWWAPPTSPNTRHQTLQVPLRTLNCTLIRHTLGLSFDTSTSNPLILGPHSGQTSIPSGSQNP